MKTRWPHAGGNGKRGRLANRNARVNGAKPRVAGRSTTVVTGAALALKCRSDARRLASHIQREPVELLERSLAATGQAQRTNPDCPARHQPRICQCRHIADAIDKWGKRLEVDLRVWHRGRAGRHGAAESWGRSVSSVRRQPPGGTNFSTSRFTRFPLTASATWRLALIPISFMQWQRLLASHRVKSKDCSHMNTKEMTRCT